MSLISSRPPRCPDDDDSQRPDDDSQRPDDDPPQRSDDDAPRRLLRDDLAIVVALLVDLDSHFVRQEVANDNEVAARRALWAAQIFLEIATDRLEPVLPNLKPANDIAKLDELLEEYMRPSSRPPGRL